MQSSIQKNSTVRDGDRLVAVAPFFRSAVAVGRVTIAKRLQLVGAGQGGSLLELPQILAAPGQERDVLREVVDVHAHGRHRRALVGDFGHARPWPGSSLSG